MRKRNKQQSKMYTSKIQRQTRAGLTSRQQLIHVHQVTLQKECMIQGGRRLVRTTDRLRLKFKRVSDWERDQTVTKLYQLHRVAFARRATIADKFATELQPVLG